VVLFGAWVSCVVWFVRIILLEVREAVGKLNKQNQDQKLHTYCFACSVDPHSWSEVQ
jgi:hypothetical protein